MKRVACWSCGFLALLLVAFGASLAVAQPNYGRYDDEMYGEDFPQAASSPKEQIKILQRRIQGAKSLLARDNDPQRRNAYASDLQTMSAALAKLKPWLQNQIVITERRVRGASNMLARETDPNRKATIAHDLQVLQRELSELKQIAGGLPPIVSTNDENLVGGKKNTDDGPIVKPPRDGNEIQVLLIYGTLDTKALGATNISREKMQGTLLDSGLLPNGADTTRVGAQQPYQTTLKNRKVTVRTLDGNNASPSRILQVCRDMSSQTGTNGTVLVFYIGHGGKVGNKHKIFPLATNGNDTSNGIAREDIWQVLTANNHRATFLITDSCAMQLSEPPKPVMAPPRGAPPASVYDNAPRYLTAMLLYYRGVLDMNSADPDTGQPALYNLNDGAYFSSAFAKNAAETFESNSFSENDLKGLIQRSQDDVFRTARRNKGANNQLYRKQKVHVFNGGFKTVDRSTELEKE